MILAVILLILAGRSGLSFDFVFNGGDSEIRKAVREFPYDFDENGEPFRVDSLVIDAGYLDANVMIIGDTVTIDFGPRYDLGEIILIGDVNDTLSVNRVFNESAVTEVIVNILEKWRDRGYYYCDFVIENYRRREKYIDITAMFHKGPALTVSSIELDGLKVTDREHLVRYIDLSPGDTITETSLKEAETALRGLDYITVDRSVELIPEEGYSRAGVRFGLKERRRFSLEGSGGYVPDDEGYTVWYLDTRLRNMFGRGQSVRLTADRRDRNRSVFSAGYRRPVFWIGRGTFEIDLATRDYRDQFYEFAIGAGYEIALNRISSFGMSLSGRDVEPDIGRGVSYQSYTVGIRFRLGAVAAVSDSTFQRGLDWSILYRARRYENSSGSFNDTRTEFVGELSQRIIGRFHGYGRGLVNIVKSSEKPLPAAEEILFGGPGTLRGYRNDQFAARRFLVGTIEPRLFLNRYSYLFGFIDQAYYMFYNIGFDSTLSEIEKYPRGVGFGIAVANGRRGVKISLAWGEEDAFDQPRLNITVKEQF